MRLLILLSLLICSTVHASYSELTELSELSVVPNECIVAEKGQTCSLELAITYPTLTSKIYCLAIDEQSLGCWPSALLPTSLTIKLSQDSTFTLIDQESNKSSSVDLKIKFRKASMARRRIRNPWSLF
jgi:hypothetical protein